VVNGGAPTGGAAREARLTVGPQARLGNARTELGVLYSAAMMHGGCERILVVCVVKLLLALVVKAM
jgi:hypothetical protein